jgi:hypothetical protein
VKPLKSFPPDTRHAPAYIDELTLEVTYSRQNGFRAIVTRNADKRFRIRLEKWCLRDKNSPRSGHWREDGPGRTIAATLATARVLAQEKLAETTEGVDA